MGVEARYSPGTALLIGSGNHWLLLGRPAGSAGTPHAVVVDRLWRLLGETGPVVDRVLEELAAHYPTGLPSLVLLDATPGSELSTTRGEGRLTRLGVRWTLSLSDAAGEPPAWPRLTGGIVSAEAAWVSPAGRIAAPLSAGSVGSVGETLLPDAPLDSPAPTHRANLIDGVPAHILAARAPERHFDPDRALRDTDSGVRSERTVEPAGGAEERANTTYRPARLLREQAEREQVERDQAELADRLDLEELRHVTGETVLAVYCRGGHITMAYADTCRVCREPVPPQEPQRVPRPALGVLRLPSGEAVPLDRGVVLGRKPGPVPGGEAYPHLVHLPADSTYLSRMHLQIALDGWLVLAIDLGSQGGTRLRAPGRDPIMLTPREAYVLEDGHVLDLADVYAVTFEVHQ